MAGTASESWPGRRSLAACWISWFDGEYRFILQGGEENAMAVETGKGMVPYKDIWEYSTDYGSWELKKNWTVSTQVRCIYYIIIFQIPCIRSDMFTLINGNVHRPADA